MINFSEKVCVCVKDFILENLPFFSVIFPSDNPITAGVSQITWGEVVWMTTHWDFSFQILCSKNIHNTCFNLSLSREIDIVQLGCWRFEGKFFLIGLPLNMIIQQNIPLWY